MCEKHPDNHKKNHHQLSHPGRVVAVDNKNKTYNDIYHFVFDQATDAIMVSDLKGNFTEVNFSCCSMFGYTKEELLQSNIGSLLGKEYHNSKNLCFDLIERGKSIVIESKMLLRNGSVIYVEFNAKKFDDRIILVARDVSSVKQVDGILEKSQANLHTIFDTTDTIYVLMDHDLRIVSYNARAVAFAKNELGHNIEVSEYFLDYFPIEKRPLLLNYMKAVLSGRHINYEVSYPQSSGFFNWYYVRWFPISNGGNNVYGLMMAVSDITEKKALESKLEEERFKKQIEITDAVITAEENERHAIGLELHDNVNQVLATAQLFVGLAKNSEHIRTIDCLNEIERLIAKAINEIRNLSHSMMPPVVDESGLLNSLAYLLQTIAKGTSIIIKTEIKIDETIVPNKLKLAIYRIVQEQLNNILKHAKAKTIILKMVQTDKKLMLSIKDDGTGFDPSQKSNGIGLMNIKTRASLSNGVVEIISSPGKGCELVVSFN